MMFVTEDENNGWCRHETLAEAERYAKSEAEHLSTGEEVKVYELVSRFVLTPKVTKRGAVA